MKTNRGITLIALTLTIIVLIILASVTTYSGISTVKSSKLNKFKQELEIMQAEVNVLYEKYKDNLDTIDIGKDISTEIDSTKKAQANDAFTVCGDVSDEDKTGYRLFDNETIKELDIEGIDREYLVNVAKRDIICLEGFKQDGKIYYRLKDFTEKNNVEYGITNEDITFDVNATELSENQCKIVISNIKFSKYVGKGKIYYKKLENDSTWGTTTTVEKDAKDNNNYSFTVNKAGKYQITIEDAAGKTTNKEITVTMSGFLPIPENAVISEIPGEYEEIDKGKVIYVMKDADGDGIIDQPDWNDPEKMRTTYDQFVWIPVPNAVLDLSSNSTALSSEDNIKAAVQAEINAGRYPMAIKNSDGNYFGVLYQFSLDSTTNTVKVEPLIGDSSDASWTPLCEKYTELREPAYLTSSSTGDASSYNNVGITESLLQTEFNTMVNRVSSKKGFWVGRYETSNFAGTSTTSMRDTLNETTVAADLTNKITVIKATITGISYDSSIPNFINWYRMYSQQKNYSNLASITSTSSMIWGSQWYQIMIWMRNEENTSQISKYVVNAVGMGNFGNISGVDDGWNLEEEPAPTGYKESYKVKNIYDLAGNLEEWTLLSYDEEARSSFGSFFGNKNIKYTRPSYVSAQNPLWSEASYGSRITLY